VKTRRADYCAVLRLEDQKRASGFDPAAKIFPKNGLRIAIADGVLFPNQRVGAHSEESVPIVRSQWPENDQFPAQSWLEPEWHGEKIVARVQRECDALALRSSEPFW
jgi:hypothetical protein